MRVGLGLRVQVRVRLRLRLRLWLTSWPTVSVCLVCLWLCRSSRSGIWRIVGGVPLTEDAAGALLLQHSVHPFVANCFCASFNPIPQHLRRNDIKTVPADRRLVVNRYHDGVFEQNASLNIRAARSLVEEKLAPYAQLEPSADPSHFQNALLDRFGATIDMLRREQNFSLSCSCSCIALPTTGSSLLCCRRRSCGGCVVHLRRTNALSHEHTTALLLFLAAPPEHCGVRAPWGRRRW